MFAHAAAVQKGCGCAEMNMQWDSQINISCYLRSLNWHSKWTFDIWYCGRYRIFSSFKSNSVYTDMESKTIGFDDTENTTTPSIEINVHLKSVEGNIECCVYPTLHTAFIRNIYDLYVYSGIKWKLIKMFYISIVSPCEPLCASLSIYRSIAVRNFPRRVVFRFVCV